MKVKVLYNILLPALQSVSRSVGVKATLPVLGNVLIQTDKGRLKLSATNLELGVIKLLNCEVLEEGEITVPAKTLLELVQALPQEEIELESAQELLKISVKKFSATLNGISASEFPTIPLSGEGGLLLKADVLLSSIPQISFAAATDEGRPVLTGILTEVKKDRLELVATDGFRLARKSAMVENGENGDLKVLIPRRTFEEVVRLIAEELDGTDGSEDTIEIKTSENQNQMIFKIGQTQLSSRLIEGSFPAWEKIIPTNIQNRTVVDRVELIKAVKLASVFARSEANIIKIETGKSALKLISESKELGFQEGSIEGQIEGESIVIAFNSKFLQEALSACSASQISIEFSGGLSPALIKPIGEDGLEYVVMPIRLS